MTSDKTLPLKKVVIRDGDYFRPPPGGSGPKVFGTVTLAARTRMAGEVRDVQEHFRVAFQALPKVAAVARVRLKDEALAKSHRPSRLFEAADCPIVGVGGFGELLVSVRAATMPQLQDALRTSATKEAVANISTIKAIEPFSLAESQLAALAEALTEEPTLPVKLRLFRHGTALIDGALERAFLAQAKELHVAVDRIDYGGGLAIYRLQGLRPRDVASLGRFVGTQSLGTFPEFHVVRPAAQPIGKLTPATFPAPTAGVDYPVVGLIDTGVEPSNALIAPWIAGREVFVPAAARDYEHGTFVGGLLVHSRALNHDDARFPECPCRILDVVALPASGKIREDELLAILREVVPKHPEIPTPGRGSRNCCTSSMISVRRSALTRSMKRRSNSGSIGRTGLRQSRSSRSKSGAGRWPPRSTKASCVSPRS